MIKQDVKVMNLDNVDEGDTFKNRSLKQIIKDYKSKMTLSEKILDKIETVYYTLGGRYIYQLTCSIGNNFKALVRYISGQGYVSNLDIIDFPGQSARYMVNRLKIIRQRILDGESYCDWPETFKCLYPSDKDLNILSVLNDVIFAFEYIYDDFKHKKYYFEQAYGYSLSDCLNARWNEENAKIDKLTAQADYKQFTSVGGLEDQLIKRKEKGLQLFVKYYETLWD